LTQIYTITDCCLTRSALGSYPPSYIRWILSTRIASISFEALGAGATSGPTKIAVPVEIAVTGSPLSDGGDSEEWRGTRLQWLDSDLAVAGDTVPAPYSPINVTRRPDAGQGGAGGVAVQMLDKHITIGADGMLSSIKVGTVYVVLEMYQWH
jgi:hypothetical protein